MKHIKLKYLFSLPFSFYFRAIKHYITLPTTHICIGYLVEYKHLLNGINIFGRIKKCMFEYNPTKTTKMNTSASVNIIQI